MHIAIIYISPNGTTGKSAELLKTGFELLDYDVSLLDIGTAEYRGK